MRQLWFTSRLICACHACHGDGPFNTFYRAKRAVGITEDDVLFET